MPKIIPIRDEVVVRPLEHSAKIGHIHVPDTVQRKRKLNNGIVVAIGPLVSQFCKLEIGDHVGYGAYDGTQIALENGLFHILHEDSIMCRYIPSDVRLIDTQTMKKLIQERFGEVMKENMERTLMHRWQMTDIQSWESAILDRIDTLPIAEGFEL